MPRKYCFTQDELYDMCEKNQAVLKFFYEYTDNALHDLDIINARTFINKFIENDKYTFYPRTNEQKRLQQLDRFEDIVESYIDEVEKNPEKSPLKGLDLIRAQKLAERSKLLLNNLKRNRQNTPSPNSPKIDSIANFIDSLPPILSPNGSPLPPIKKPLATHQKINLF